MKLLKKIKNLLNINSQNNHILKELENIKLQNGEILNRLNKNNKSTIILDNEFKVYSQWGEDGIISYLIDNIKIKNNFFVFNFLKIINQVSQMRKFLHIQLAHRVGFRIHYNKLKLSNDFQLMHGNRKGN